MTLEIRTIFVMSVSLVSSLVLGNIFTPLPPVRGGRRASLVCGGPAAASLSLCF